MKRFVIVDIDTLISIFKDYLGVTYIPGDAKPIKLQRNEATRELGIIAVSDEWEGDGVLKIDFQLKRYFPVSTNAV